MKRGTGTKTMRIPLLSIAAVAASVLASGLIAAHASGLRDMEGLHCYAYIT
jgi:hypothetical protein